MIVAAQQDKSRSASDLRCGDGYTLPDCDE